MSAGTAAGMLTWMPSSPARLPDSAMTCEMIAPQSPPCETYRV